MPRVAGKRACDQCNFRRVKCDGEAPCSRCTNSQIDCTYLKARGGKRQQSLRTLTPATQDDSQPVAAAGPSIPNLLNNGISGPTPPFTGFFTSPEPASFYTNPSLEPGIDIDGGNALQITREAVSARPESADGSDLSPWSSVWQSEALPCWISQCINTDAVPGSELSVSSSLPTTNHSPSTAATREDSLSDSILIPNIALFFERIHPIMPIFSRTYIFSRLDREDHRTSREFAAMLLAMSAFALVQPIKASERQRRPALLQQARLMLEESIAMQANAMLGQHSGLESVLASFYTFGCLFGLQETRAATFRLREAVTLGRLLRLHDSEAYRTLPNQEKERWLRAFWVLSITERAYALQHGETLGFPGNPGRDMAALRASLTNSQLADFPMQTLGLFDDIDESFLVCWRRQCIGVGCPLLTPERAVQLHTSLDARVAESDPPQSIQTYNKAASNWDRSQIQQIDTLVTKAWLHSQLWKVALWHGIVSSEALPEQLRPSYVLHVARSACEAYQAMPSASRDAHGIGLFDKLCDIALALVKATELTKTITSSFEDLALMEDLLDAYQGLLREAPDDAQAYCETVKIARDMQAGRYI